MSLEREILGLSIAYALVAILLLLALTRTALPWWLKAGAIALTSAFYVVAFFRTQGLLGWSAIDPLPERFQLLWARTTEPDLATKTPGAIHLWVEALDDANLPSGVPRAYRLRFSAALARKVETARTEIIKGHPQAGRALDFGIGDGQRTTTAPIVAAREGAEPGGDPSSGGFLDPSFLGGDSKSVDFAPMPVPKLPPKDLPSPP
jgi:hypothetical protein